MSGRSSSETPRDALWRVATLNIWNRQGPWAQRLPLIRAGLEALDADAIGLQEVMGFSGLPSQAHEIADGTGWNVHYAPAWEVGGGLTMGNAILTRHPLLDVQILPLPSPPGVDTRTVAFARIDCAHGPMPVFVTHLTFQEHLASARRLQVRVLANHVAALAPISGPPPVLLGDFNADPDSDEMRFLRGLTTIDGTSVYFADCWSTTSGAEPGAGPGWTYDRRNPYALRSREPSRRIDYVYVRGPTHHLCGEPLGARLCLTDAVDGIYPSDHYGLVAEIYAARRHHDPF
ncbi:MAG: endonuclease/exonuclease/phosphatase family protein [Deltaproteobacteria bacterium]|nr:endonuclease/exonuclease/phosphatase family protein [Deltaproteobacteria bacterium]